jgi:hypothetical protein
LKSFNIHVKESVWSTRIGRIVPIYIICLTLGSGLKRFCQFRTCVKSSVVWGPGPVVRRCSPKSLSLPDPAPRRPPTHTSDSAPIVTNACLYSICVLQLRCDAVKASHASLNRHTLGKETRSSKCRRDQFSLLVVMLSLQGNPPTCDLASRIMAK